MVNIAFDIETMPNAAMIDRLPEAEVKTGNLKDPEKIAAKVAEAKAEQIAAMALNPLYGRICAAAYAGNDEQGAITLRCDSDEEETLLIETLFKIFSTGVRLITFNGTNFDLPFLYKRAVILGIDPRQYGMPPLAELTRFGSKYHIDLMRAWCGFQQYEKLENLAAVLIGDHKDEIDFRDFPELIKTPEGREKISKYNLQDAALTFQLFNRLNGILF